MTTRRSVISLIFLGVITVAACSGGSGDDDDFDGPPADATPNCAAARDYQDFTNIQSRIFAPSCLFMDCHDAVVPEAAMDLSTTATAHAALVNVDSQMAVAAGPPPWKRVVPGSPELSYLMVILGHVPGPIDPVIMTMPSNSPLLCVEKRDAIARWITAGAAMD